MINPPLSDVLKKVRPSRTHLYIALFLHKNTAAELYLYSVYQGNGPEYQAYFFYVHIKNEMALLFNKKDGI